MVAKDPPGLPLHDVSRAAVKRVQQEGADAHRANEADAVGVWLCLHAQAALGAHAANLGLAGDVPHRKERTGQDVRAHAPQEVGLVLVLVGGAQEADGPLGCGLLARALLSGRGHAGVVARGHKVRARGKGALREGAELDGLVAHDVRVGRVAASVGVHQVVHDGGLVLGLTVPNLEVYAQSHGHALGVREVVSPGALEAGQVPGPVAHVDGRDVVALLHQQRAGKRRVHAAGKAGKDPLALACVCAHWRPPPMMRAALAAASSSEIPRRDISARTTRVTAATA